MKKLFTATLLAIGLTTAQAQDGFYFDGSNDVITVPHDDNYDIGRNDFTIEAIVKAEQNGSYPQIVSTRNSTSTGFLFGLAGTEPYMRMGTGNYIFSNAVSVADGKCHHIAFSRTNDILALYIDGEFYGEKTVTQDISSPHDLLIGNDYDSEPFKGFIREVRFWNIGRSLQEINANKNTEIEGNTSGLIGYWKLAKFDTLVKDYSPLMNTGYIGNDITSGEDSEPSFTTGSCQVEKLITQDSISVVGAYFDGTNDKITAPHIDDYNIGTNDFTIEAWIKAEQNGDYPQIVSTRNATSTGFLFGLDGSEPYMRMGTGNYMFSNSPNVIDGTCHQVAFSRKNDTLTLYVDGLYVGYKKVTQDISSPHDLIIGNDYDNEPFKGIIKEVRFWNVGLDSATINNQLYTALSGEEDGLIGYWKINETGDAQYIMDYSTNMNDAVLGANSNVESTDPLLGYTCEGDVINAISANNVASTISIYPNPVNDILNINSNDDVTVEIYSNVGQLIMTSKGNRVNTQNLESGNYVVRVITNGEISVHALLK